LKNADSIKILLFIFLGISALILSCGSEGDDSGVTIVFKHGKIAGQTGHLGELIRKFQESNPGIKVKEEVLPSLTDQQHQFYVTNLEAGARTVIWDGTNQSGQKVTSGVYFAKLNTVRGQSVLKMSLPK